MIKVGRMMSTEKAIFSGLKDHLLGFLKQDYPAWSVLNFQGRMTAGIGRQFHSPDSRCRPQAQAQSVSSDHGVSYSRRHLIIHLLTFSLKPEFDITAGLLIIGVT